MRFFLIIILFLTAATATSAGVRAKKKELEKVHAQLEIKKREIQTYRRLRLEVEQELAHLESEKGASQRAVSELRKELKQAQGRENKLMQELGAISHASQQGREFLSEELRSYVQALPAQSDFYGQSDLWEDSFRRAALREKTYYLARLQSSQNRMAVAQKEIQFKESKLKVRERQASEEFNSRQTTYREKEGMYQETEQKLAHALKEIHELEETKRDLAHLIERLKPKRSGNSRAAMKVARHSLPWPVPGRVVGTFGKEEVPELHTWIIRNGIEIASEPQSQVQPVGRGKVIFAGHFRSYGNVVIVEHEDGFYGVYGRLNSLLRQKGDYVTATTKIGTVSSDGKVGLLYFEIRQDGMALDPLSWLQKK